MTLRPAVLTAHPLTRPDSRRAYALAVLESYPGRLKRRVAALLRRPAPARAVRKIDARQGYRLWAPAYSVETATSFLEEELAEQMLRGLPLDKLLDAGCGTGRRIAGIPGATGMDASPEMLAAGAVRDGVVGDVRAMPFPSNRFDMVWCRLVLGHIPNPQLAYRELARVCAPGGYVFVSDFHPDAVAAGHQRTFTGPAGAVYEIEHYVHAGHAQLGVEAGLEPIERQDGVVGPSIRDFYLRGIGFKAYKRDAGLKLVAAYLFRKPAG